MKPRDRYELPASRRQDLQKAVRLEWVTIALMLTVITLIYLTMGSSQAMKAAWIEDILSLVPPIAFLISARYEHRAPNAYFPYGYHRAASIAFLVASTALFIFGVFIMFDSVMTLVMREHPTIGTTRIFGRDVWSGWLMIAVLAYSAVPPVVLGRLKLPLSRRLHDKTLHADADMNKADWLSAAAGILGILGIGIGWWWADAVAAGVIALDVVRDGVTNLKNVVEDLMDRRPKTVDHRAPDDIPERLAAAMEGLSWVRQAAVRLREEGHVLNGEVFVVPRDEAGLVGRLQEAAEVARALHWRLHDVVVTPVASLDEEGEASRNEEQR